MAEEAHPANSCFPNTSWRRWAKQGPAEVREAMQVFEDSTAGQEQSKHRALLRVLHTEGPGCERAVSEAQGDLQGG